MAASFRSHSTKKGAGRREFFDAPVIRIRDHNISAGINSNSRRRIKFSFSGSSAAFKHVSYTFRERTELRRRCRRYLIERSSRQGAHALLKLWNVLGRDVQHVERPYSSAKGK